MANYQILTDSASDLPAEMIEALGVKVIPLTVNFRGKPQRDTTDEGLKELYDAWSKGESSTTAAVNPSDWAKLMEPVLQNGEDILVLAFSSGLSTTYQSAQIAAWDLQSKYPGRRICVTDTLCASLGQGLLVWYACKKRDEGLPLDKLTAWVEENKLHLCHWFTVSDLMYLKRGGRVSAATALVGTMLRIKPVLHVDNAGHLINMGKARGRKASIDALVDKFQETSGDYDNSTVFICHGDCLEDAEYLKKTLIERCGPRNVVIGYTGAVIGSHSGPGTLALFFMGDHR